MEGDVYLNQCMMKKQIWLDDKKYLHND
uniref:Uncharacterized protein n=1 Tax=Lepeophtheirus salmonis TaxID=72036 RepID=A0A0K2U580_LEPSM